MNLWGKYTQTIVVGFLRLTKLRVHVFFWGENLPPGSFQLLVGLCIALFEALASCFTLHPSIPCLHLHSVFSRVSSLHFLSKRAPDNAGPLPRQSQVHLILRAELHLPSLFLSSQVGFTGCTVYICRDTI